MGAKYFITAVLFFLSGHALNAQGIFQRQYPGFRPEPVFTIELNSGNLFLGGAYGLLMKSTDGGLNWNDISINSKHDILINAWRAGGTGLLYSSDSVLYRTVNSGANWTQVTKFPFGVNGIIFAGNTAFLCAYNLAGKSFNGGLNWTYFIPETGPVNNYTSLYFTDSLTGYISAVDAVTDYTSLFRTTNGGLGWNKHNTAIDNFYITGISFVSALTGWAAGNRFGTVCLIKTTNAGVNWTELYVNQPPSAVNGLYFANQLTGYISTELNILKSTNGGANWNQFVNDYGITASEFSDTAIYFSDTRGRTFKSNHTGITDTVLGKSNYRFGGIFRASQYNLYTTGENYRNFRTTNGGLNWTPDYPQGTPQIKLFSFSDANTGFALAGRGSVLRTLNFGNNWQTLFDTAAELSGLYTATPSACWASGNGFILRTTNGGLNWAVSRVNGEINKMWFADSNTGYSIMNDSMRKTTDGGNEWTPQFNAHAYDFSFINVSTGWTLNYSDSTAEIRKTINGGVNYIFCGRLPGNVYKIQFINPATGYASGNDYIMRTSDGGITWKKAEYPKSSYLKINDFIFSDENSGWFCGDNGLILHTTTGSSIYAGNNSQHLKDPVISVMNTPNPFNNSTRIIYDLPLGGEATLKIFNILGKEVFSFEIRNASKGRNYTDFRTDNLPSGIYFILLKNQNYTGTGRMALVK